MSPPAPNGAAAPGRAAASQPGAILTVGPNLHVRRDELVRLLTDELRRLGYTQSAAELERESNVPFESHDVAQFRSAILAGQWADAVQLLPTVGVPPGQPDVPNGAYATALFLIKEQQYLELLEQQNVPAALTVLREELTPLQHDPTRLHELSSYLMCGPPDMLRATAQWTGVAGGSRATLLHRLQTDVLPPSAMVRDGRLETLIAQALARQVAQCTYHSAEAHDGKPLGLLADHACETRDTVPATCLATFTDPEDEVWHLAFSHAGDRLAAVGQDGRLLIWDVRTRHLLFRLHAHVLAATYLAWSPDDKYLVSCSNDTKARIWDPANGTCVTVLDAHSEFVTAAGWLPDSRRLITGGLDKQLFLWNVDGTLVHRWSNNARVSDMQVSDDGRFVVVMSTDKVRVHDLHTRTEISSLTEAHGITSVCLSKDGRYLLLNLSSQEIHLWDLFPSPTAENIDSPVASHMSPSSSTTSLPLRSPLIPNGHPSPTPASASAALSTGIPARPDLAATYTGHKQGRFVIRSALGGYGEAFIASGSEDARVYVWHRASRALVNVLEGHSDTVNAVAWNPRVPGMLASASDDRTVRLSASNFCITAQQ
ncbi:hypothetical protein GGF32_002644 [Allomyces javanicus]|nr:hypothetical protein GGF32_002644 [Allomyces javanicus]